MLFPANLFSVVLSAVRNSGHGWDHVMARHARPHCAARARESSAYRCHSLVQFGFSLLDVKTAPSSQLGVWRSRRTAPAR
jgi:hypothetical protein